MEPDRLPVAPRPYRDELLSSWMARVACRYGLTAEELAGHFAVDDNCLSPLAIDDRAPTLDQTRLWAQACGVDPERLQRLALSKRYPRRSQSWYVRAGPEWAPSARPRSTPVCVACFAADQAGGRDGYLRAGWRLAEHCICPTHGELLRDHCVSCHRHLCVAFCMLDGRAQPTCSFCGSILANRGGEGGQAGERDLVGTALAVQQRITASVDRENPEQEQFEKALAILWAPLDHPAAARPVLKLWFNEAGWRCPYEVRHAVGVKTPLGQLPVRWRFLTLLALEDVFGTELGGEMPSLAAQFVRRAAPRQIRFSKVSGRPYVRLLRRSSAEYERLARQILADPRWIAAEALTRRKRERIRARLIDAALAGDTAVPGTRLSSQPRCDPQAIQIS